MSLPSNRFRVTHFITELNVGGAENLLFETVTRTNHKIFDLDIVCIKDAGVVARRFKEAGYSVYNLDIRSKLDARISSRLFNHLRTHKSDILHTHLFHASTLGPLLGRLARVPIIISTRHGTELGGWHREVINAFSSTLRDRTVTVSNKVRQEELRYTLQKKDKVVTIPNGIDTAAYFAQENSFKRECRHEWKISADEIIVGTTARFVEQKGLKYLIESLGHLMRRYTNIRLMLVGDGPLMPKLRRQVENLGLTNMVVFAGEQTEIVKMLSMMDIFVLPSISEGFGIALLEAMSCEIPVVATNTGGISEVISDSSTGILVPVRNPEAIAKAIGLLVDNPEVRLKMGRDARRYVINNFDISRTVQCTHELYMSLIVQKRLTSWLN